MAILGHRHCLQEEEEAQEGQQPLGLEGEVKREQPFSDFAAAPSLHRQALREEEARCPKWPSSLSPVSSFAYLPISTNVQTQFFRLKNFNIRCRVLPSSNEIS